jgi:hypothetical protein
MVSREDFNVTGSSFVHATEVVATNKFSKEKALESKEGEIVVRTKFILIYA